MILLILLITLGGLSFATENAMDCKDGIPRHLKFAFPPRCDEAKLSSPFVTKQRIQLFIPSKNFTEVKITVCYIDSNIRKRTSYYYPVYDKIEKQESTIRSIDPDECRKITIDKNYNGTVLNKSTSTNRKNEYTGMLRKNEKINIKQTVLLVIYELQGFTNGDTIYIPESNIKAPFSKKEAITSKTYVWDFIPVCQMENLINLQSYITQDIIVAISPQIIFTKNYEVFHDCYEREINLFQNGFGYMLDDTDLPVLLNNATKTTSRKKRSNIIPTDESVLLMNLMEEHLPQQIKRKKREIAEEHISVFENLLTQICLLHNTKLDDISMLNKTNPQEAVEKFLNIKITNSAFVNDSLHYSICSQFNFIPQNYDNYEMINSTPLQNKVQSLYGFTTKITPSLLPYFNTLASSNNSRIESHTFTDAIGFSVKKIVHVATDEFKNFTKDVLLSQEGILLYPLQAAEELAIQAALNLLLPYLPYIGNSHTLKVAMMANNTLSSPNPFKGATDERDITTFLLEYSSWCNALNISTKDRLRKLVGCLKNDALLHYKKNINNNPRITMTEMETELQTVYHHNAEFTFGKFQALIERKQQNNESVVKWAQWCKSAVPKAYPFIKDTANLENICLNHFLNGLLPELKGWQKTGVAFPKCTNDAIVMILTYIKNM